MKGFWVLRMRGRPLMLSCIHPKAGQDADVRNSGGVCGHLCLRHWRRLRRREGWIFPEELQELRSHDGLDFGAVSADFDLTVAIKGVAKMPRSVKG